ncbi:MAG: hypothetical protein HLUCCA05_05255 [Roseibaca calidilacus]|uniref:Tetratricopeptide repeat-like domain-containing protein n=1 Tax=Roseibaca calidilacus TaxID=1666912 RepID=A0A0P7VUP2_9RHOB|nr:hypothetical protein [Roseibaca calidilacus]KPP90822.1 MAG: hypothetical protein HLUCCA05_05255 [Roseibaca calidilacus]CUX83622.1 hypothetical protein Ga0058931_3091 [Roseibaca calidilacus]
MSNPESFIDEVSEELRRDRAMQYLRKYGWIAVVVVVLIVGGTAWNEWRKASAQASAEAFGESVLSALENNDTADRIAVLADIEATGAQQGLLQLLRAGELLETDRVAALDALEAAAQDDNLPDAYRQLAALKRVIAGQGVLPLEERQSVVAGLAQAGQPFRPLALEQSALLSLEAGDEAGAIAILQDLLEQSDVSESLRQRVTQLLIGLGAETGAA